MGKLNRSERECLIFLQSIDGFGGMTIGKLKKTFGSYQNIYEMNEEMANDYMTSARANNFLEARKKINPKRLYENMIARDIKHIAVDDDIYPNRLRNIPDKPVGLFVKGDLPLKGIPQVAVIGARNNSMYGEVFAKAFARCIATNGIGIVSGLARGIDSIAQEEAVRAGEKTYAVLGCGADICYPPSSKQLYYDILKNKGGIISEYAPGVMPIASRFPPRNRIIAGLSDAVLVIEAKEKSGTMITVDMALEQGREVYALPGRIDDALSKGCNDLIRQGAGMLQTPEGFVKEFLEGIRGHKEYYNFFEKNGKNVKGKYKERIVLPNTPQERTIYKMLDYNPLPIGIILERVNGEISMPLPNLLQWLTNMTISGYAACVGGTNYYKI